MEDAKIIDLYWQRSDQAIAETDAKYGAYCRTIAYNILSSAEDTEECVNDTYFSAWNSMPDKRPKALSAYLAKITRNHALSRVFEKNRQKRGGGELTLALDELDDCVASVYDLEREVEDRELERVMNAFLRSLPDTERQIFLCRYWFLAPVAEIAERFGFSKSKTASMLHRTRKKLQQHLRKEELC